MNPYEPIRTHTVSEVAEALDCSIDTVRRYSSEFGEFLSAEARPGQGTRLFTALDILYLQEARQLLRGGATYAQAREFLTTYEPPPLDMGTDSEEVGTPAPVPLAVSQIQDALERIAGNIELLSTQLASPEQGESERLVHQHVEALARRLERLEVENAELHERSYSPLLWMLIGAIIMGVIGAGIAITVINLIGG